jgi:hypothetical protein
VKPKTKEEYLTTKANKAQKEGENKEKSRISSLFRLLRLRGFFYQTF